MQKFKNLFQTISGKLRRITAVYPFTAVLIVLTSLMMAVFVDQSGTFGKFMEDYGIPFMMLWTAGCYFSETIFSGNRSLRVAGAAISMLTAAALVYFSNNNSDIGKELVSHWVYAYVIVLVSMSLYRNFKKSGTPFSSYCTAVVYELSCVAVINAVLSVGIVLVVAAFCALLLNGNHYTLIFRTEFLITGCAAGFGFLEAQTAEEKKLPRFFSVIIEYVLMTLLLLAFVIIYAYILKIIITRVVPSNEIFRILAGLFICGLPVWTMIGSFPQDRLMPRIGVKLPFFFAPFLFLQGYAIRERILAYGMTPARYLCLMLMAFEIIYILVYALRKRDAGIMLPVFALMAVISLVLPHVNMYDTAIRSQKKIFDRYIDSDFSALTPEEQSSLAGAYYYLKGSAAGEAMLSGIPEEKIDPVILSGKIGVPDFDQNIYVYRDFPLLNEDIGDYTSMTMLTTVDPEAKEAVVYDPHALRFFDQSGEQVLTADLSDFVQICIDEVQSGRQDLSETASVITLEDGRVLRLLTCSFTVEPEGIIHYLNMDALLYTK